MDSLDEVKKKFEEELHKEQNDAANELQQEIAQLRGETKPLDEFEKRAIGLHSDIQTEPSSAANVEKLINLTHTNPLHDLDQSFLAKFKILNYYPENLIKHTTYLCDSLEEFFTPEFDLEQISEQNRKAFIENAILTFKDQVKEYNYWGYNLPSVGCFINGWLIGYRFGMDPKQVRPGTEAFNFALKIATHEKLGHGFIDGFSTLGKLSTKLGWKQHEIASSFGLQTSNDMSSHIAVKQYEAIFRVTRFLHEGWASWIEDNFGSSISAKYAKAPHNKNELLSALSHLPGEIRGRAISAYNNLFSENVISQNEIFASILFFYELENNHSKVIESETGQKLRYVLGECLCNQCAEDLGELCLPYVVLIAANVEFDPEKIGLTDLERMTLTEPIFNPDCRLAVLSKLKLTHRGSVEELVHYAYSILNYLPPFEIREK